MRKVYTFKETDSLSDVTQYLREVREQFPSMKISTVCIRRISNRGYVDIETLLMPKAIYLNEIELKTGCIIDETI